MSRPNWSVPSGFDHDGSVSVAVLFISIGSWGARRGAATAAEDEEGEKAQAGTPDEAHESPATPLP